MLIILNLFSFKVGVIIPFSIVKLSFKISTKIGFNPKCIKDETAVPKFKHGVIFGHVVGIHINDDIIVDGKVEIVG